MADSGYLQHVRSLEPIVEVQESLRQKFSNEDQIFGSGSLGISRLVILEAICFEFDDQGFTRSRLHLPGSDLRIFAGSLHFDGKCFSLHNTEEALLISVFPLTRIPLICVRVG